MSHISNSDLIKHILTELFYITSRRATESLAALLIATVIEHLEKNYDFLSNIKPDESSQLIARHHQSLL